MRYGGIKICQDSGLTDDRGGETDREHNAFVDIVW